MSIICKVHTTQRYYFIWKNLFVYLGNRFISGHHFISLLKIKYLIDFNKNSIIHQCYIIFHIVSLSVYCVRIYLSNVYLYDFTQSYPNYSTFTIKKI